MEDGYRRPGTFAIVDNLSMPRLGTQDLKTLVPVVTLALPE